MNARLSVYLDGLRIFAAVVVLLSHWAYERFTGGSWLILRELNLGSDAVALFFVLSGLVIAFTAATKDRNASEYFFNRATRIYSVAVPALAATFLLDRFGAALDPQAYAGWWHNELSIWAMAFHGLTFSSEWHVPGLRLGSNGPWWSLSYEVAYYLLFAAALFLDGPRRMLALACISLVVGLKALLLLPVWLAGVLAWRIIAQDRLPAVRLVIIAMIVLPGIAYAAALAVGVPGLLFDLTAGIAGVDPRILRSLLGFSDEFLWNALLGLLAAVHILGVAAYVRQAARREPGRFARQVRWLAGASFSLYLLHYPVLQFLDATLPGATGWLRNLVLLGATFLLCLAFAHLFERPLGRLRMRLRRMADMSPWRAPADRPAA